MAALELEWIPETLYNTAISAVVDNYSRSRRDIRCIPENIQFDVYYKLYQQGRLCQLGGEFCELEVFAKVLRASDKRVRGTLTSHLTNIQWKCRAPNSNNRNLIIKFLIPHMYYTLF
uniref:Uncharacterized protein n=1 Tax=Oncorhynchus tshawytscha TaxID=74940 RepID=A0AAZ3PJ96_ONCTS